MKQYNSRIQSEKTPKEKIRVIAIETAKHKKMSQKKDSDYSFARAATKRAIIHIAKNIQQATQ